jgi:Tol biopolymer transport system component
LGAQLSGLEPSWSPDGSRVVAGVADTRSKWEGAGKLVIVDVATGHETTLLKSRISYEYAVWSPRGDEIAFATGYGDIYVVRPDGTGLTRLTDSGGPCVDGAISWSSDAAQIAFARDCDGPGDRGIYVMNADGSDPRLIDGTGGVLQTAWAPDGQTLAFMRRQRYDTLPLTDDTVYSVGVDGTGSRLLALRSSSPTWSPDGRAIAVLESGVVTVLDVYGKTITTLDDPSGLTVDGIVSWSRAPLKSFPPSGTGTISGHLFAVGGPAPGLHRPLPGTIFVSGSADFHAEVGSDGSYSLVVPAGTYAVSGRSPLYQAGHLVCHASSPVTLTSGSVVKADVFCQER